MTKEHEFKIGDNVMIPGTISGYNAILRKLKNFNYHHVSLNNGTTVSNLESSDLEPVKPDMRVRVPEEMPRDVWGKVEKLRNTDSLRAALVDETVVGWVNDVLITEEREFIIARAYHFGAIVAEEPKVYVKAPESWNKNFESYASIRCDGSLEWDPVDDSTKKSSKYKFTDDEIKKYHLGSFETEDVK